MKKLVPLTVDVQPCLPDRLAHRLDHEPLVYELADHLAVVRAADMDPYKSHILGVIEPGAEEGEVRLGRIQETAKRQS